MTGFLKFIPGNTSAIYAKIAQEALALYVALTKLVKTKSCITNCKFFWMTTLWMGLLR